MSLKIFETIDFSESITITKNLPLCQKILDNVDASSILVELEEYIPADRPNTPWFAVEWEEGLEKEIKVNEALEEIKAVGFNVNGNYNQKQLCTYQSGFPWQNWQDGVGNSVKEFFIKNFPNFHRPRYVEAYPGFETTKHSDWNDNKKCGIRCHLTLDTNDECAYFVTDDQGVEHKFIFNAGEVWFINAEKMHREYNLGSTIRKSISFELTSDTLINETDIR